MRRVDLLRALPKTKRNIQRRAEAKDPAVIAIFGIAPVNIQLTEPDKLAWRRV